MLAASSPSSTIPGVGTALGVIDRRSWTGFNMVPPGALKP